MIKRNCMFLILISLLMIVLITTIGCDFKGKTGTGNKPTDTSGTKPIFSDLGGVFTGTMKLEMTLPDEFKDKGYAICYTLNPSIPDWLSHEYEGPIELPCNDSIKTDFEDDSKNVSVTIVRAACIDKNGDIVGEVQTGTYIQVKDSNRFNMPVISLVTEEDNLYGSKTGILLRENIRKKGQAWERPVHVSFIETNNKLAFAQDAGIRLFGNSSRGLVQKSFRITARKSSYFGTEIFDGSGKFYHTIFPGRLASNGEVLAVYDSFILRNGGNDSVFTGSQGDRATLLRDGLASIIEDKAADRVDGMAYRPVVVFLNGEYYGILNMRERQDEHYIENVYGITDTDNISMISNELDTSLGGRYDGTWFYYVQDNGKFYELEAFRNLLEDINKGLYTYEEAAQYIDMENLMQYYAINLFICNTDWPHNNLRVWRYTGEYDPAIEQTDGKWRFMFKDQDLSMGRYTMGMTYGTPIELYNLADSSNFRFTLVNYLDFESNVGYPATSDSRYPDSLYTQGLFHFCLKNEGFRKSFYDYCVKLATEYWPSEKLQKQIDTCYKAIKDEMKVGMFVKSFGDHQWTADLTYEQWKIAITEDTNKSLSYWAKKRSGESGYFLHYVNDILNFYE
ncbi:MAG: hypothetical protein E7385_00300 [Ruminococcaceae bacterium]|nr:hypothetical protein [Oscillospiraceae bacterium]